MKRILIILWAALLTATSAAAEYSPKTDYMAEMLSAVCAGEYAAGSEAAQRRAEKIAQMGLDYPQVEFEELWLLSKIIYAEAGSVWLPMDWKMAVGEVVLNRVASPEFPDTLREVVYQRGQYNVVNTARFASLAPRRPCVDAALRLLQGERRMVPAVVFQSDSIQGELFTMYADRRLGNTYFCLSERLELYP